MNSSEMALTAYVKIKWNDPTMENDSVGIYFQFFTLAMAT